MCTHIYLCVYINIYIMIFPHNYFASNKPNPLIKCSFIASATYPGRLDTRDSLIIYKSIKISNNNVGIMTVPARHSAGSVARRLVMQATCVGYTYKLGLPYTTPSAGLMTFMMTVMSLS